MNKVSIEDENNQLLKSLDMYNNDFTSDFIRNKSGDIRHNMKPFDNFDMKFIERVASLKISIGTMFNKGNRILDCGCGVGNMTGLLSNIGADCTGVDALESAINIANELYPDVRFTCADFTHTDFINKLDVGYKAIIFRASLSNDLNFSDQINVLEAYMSKLDRDGVLIMMQATSTKTTPHRLSPKRLSRVLKEKGYVTSGAYYSQLSRKIDIIPRSKIGLDIISGLSNFIGKVSQGGFLWTFLAMNK